MRYANVGSNKYLRKFQGSTRDLKNIRPIQFITDGSSIPYSPARDLDSYAVSLFGSGREHLWYRIGDSNADRIVAYKADMSNINQLRLPPR